MALAKYGETTTVSIETQMNMNKNYKRVDGKTGKLEPPLSGRLTFRLYLAENREPLKGS